MSDTPDQHGQTAAGERQPESPRSVDSTPVAAEIELAQAVIEDADETVPKPAPPYLRFDCTGDTDRSTTEAAEAARLAVDRGELVVLPTDTVYGIGADAFSPEAVQRLLDAKVRGRDMPPPVLIADPSMIQALAIEVPRAAEDLVARHWPGPLTVICKARTTLQMDLGDTEGTVALRVPDHELARDLLRRTGPLAVSSANISGMPAAVSCDDAVSQLGSSVAVYLDGGTLGGGDGIPSTIVDFTQDERGEVLRRGALSVEVLRETLPELVDLVDPDDVVEPEDLVEPEDPVEPQEPVEPELVEPEDRAGPENQQPATAEQRSGER
ncbi:MAG TPA: L-threonylcarbamoyladenylate synthase [Propionibacteriaceae bacterium]|nr:L-threonylcarbamoyladenylate synthase [Propionibacteriaceae bacterium]